VFIHYNICQISFHLNKTADNVGKKLKQYCILNNLQPTADFNGLFLLDNQPHYEKIKHIK